MDEANAERLEQDAGAVAVREAIRVRARAFGFSAVGFAPAEVPDAAAQAFDRFLAAGRHGDMAWMSDTAERRRQPRALWPEARTVIVLGLSYAPGADPLSLLAVPDRGSISVYARNKDYHDTVKRRLKAFASWLHNAHGAAVKVFVDTAPVLEKPLAESAGLGWRGKHTNLVSRLHGSWLFLGEVFTALPLPPDDPGIDRCGRCDRCQSICPTDAFPAPYELDARRCIAYLTIEHKGHIPREFRALLGNRIYGCDDCLAVCPWNKFAAATREPDFLPRAELTAPRLADLLSLDEAGFRAIFAGSPIKRIGRDRFVRNVLIASGNAAGSPGASALMTPVRSLLSDPAAIVRAMAVWALARLDTAEGFAATRRHLAPGEEDAAVRAEWDADPVTDSA